MSLATTGLHRSRCPSTHERSGARLKFRSRVKVTINGYTWRSTVGNRGGIQYLVVNVAARRHAGVKVGDTVAIVLEPDTEKPNLEIPIKLRKALGAKLTEKMNRLSFSHKKEFVVWYS